MRRDQYNLKNSNLRNYLFVSGVPTVLGLGTFSLLFAGTLTSALVLPSIFSNASATNTSGAVQLDTQISASIAMKIVSPNDVNPDCTPEDLNGDSTVDANDTYGIVNRYASSTGDNSGRVVDTFDGAEGGADEINTNTSCTTLSMTPNTYDSTYSDVTVFTNSPSGYALTVQSAEDAQPALVSLTDNTQSIPAGVLTETDSTIEDDNGNQVNTKVVLGGQNTWSYKTDNGIITDWTAMSTSPATIKSYDTYTIGGDTTRVTYGISSGTNPTGKYATSLTYTATMFDSANPYVGNITTSETTNLTIAPTSLSIPLKASKSLTVTPAEGYYLSEVTCPTGYTCSGYTTDKSNSASAETQTITITNDSATNTIASLDLAAILTDPWACPVATKDSPCVVNNIEYIRLADGHLWTKSSQGTADWYGAASLCPSGTNLPSKSIFDTLISKYGSGSGIYNATNWSGNWYWASTAYNGSIAHQFYIDNSRVHTDYDGAYKTYSHDVVCYH